MDTDKHGCAGWFALKAQWKLARQPLRFNPGLISFALTGQVSFRLRQTSARQVVSCKFVKFVSSFSARGDTRPTVGVLLVGRRCGRSHHIGNTCSHDMGYTFVGWRSVGERSEPIWDSYNSPLRICVHLCESVAKPGVTTPTRRGSRHKPLSRRAASRPDAIDL
jgi:hypothetical protein